MHVNTDYVEQIFSRLKSSAKKRNIDFSLTKTQLCDMTFPITCPILGIPIRQETGSQTDNSVSVDRKDSTKGYTIDNIIIISWKANRLKSNASVDELEKISDFYTNIDNY